MNRLSRAALLLGVVAAGLLLGRLAWRERPGPAPSLPLPSPAAIAVREATLVLRHAGQKQAEVQAARVEVSRDLRYATFTGVARAVFYDRGQVALRVGADEIVLDRQSNNLRARGHLLLESPQGYRLEAPEGRWVAARQQLIFPSGVALRTADSVIQAQRLVIDIGLQSLVLEGAVDISFRVAGGIR